MSQTRGTNKGDPCIGLTDKLYWRVGFSMWHCFKRTQGGGYEMLCHAALRRERIGGQACSRPNVEDRCPTCNRMEMVRRGWSVPGPSHQAPNPYLDDVPQRRVKSAAVKRNARAKEQP